MIDGQVHLALSMGDISPEEPVLVRVHVENTLCDMLGSLREDCGWPLRDAMCRIAKEGKGIVIILRLSEESDVLAQQINNYEKKDRGEEISSNDNGEDLRTFGIGAQILRDLGVKQMRVLSAPKKMHALSGFDLEVVEYVQD